MNITTIGKTTDGLLRAKQKYKILDNDTELFNKLKDESIATKFANFMPSYNYFDLSIVENIISYTKRLNGEIISLIITQKVVNENHNLIIEYPYLFSINFYNTFYDSFELKYTDLTMDEFINYFRMGNRTGSGDGNNSSDYSDYKLYKTEEQLAQLTEEHLISFNKDRFQLHSDEKLYRTNSIHSHLSYHEVKDILLNL